MNYKIQELEKNEQNVLKSVVNSNYDLIKPFLINKYQHQAYNLSDAWLTKYFPKHKCFKYIEESDPQTPIGVVSLKKIVDFAYIEFFSIKNEYIHQKHGEKMCELIEQKVRDLKLEKIRIFVHKEAKWAQNAYKKYGFHLLLSDKAKIRDFENGRVAPYFLVNHLLYEKVLK